MADFRRTLAERERLELQSFSLADIHDIVISPKVFSESFCKSQLPHKSVNLSLIITNMKNKLTDMWGS